MPWPVACVRLLGVSQGTKADPCVWVPLTVRHFDFWRQRCLVQWSMFAECPSAECDSSSLLAQVLPRQASATPPCRLCALIVGIDVPPRNRGACDAEAVAVKLTSLQFAVLKVLNPTMVDFRREFQHFLQSLSRGCSVVVYFSGLAYADDRGMGYWVPAVPAGESLATGARRCCVLTSSSPLPVFVRCALRLLRFWLLR